ncbi:MAG: TspO/MBR family protein [bacterium]
MIPTEFQEKPWWHPYSLITAVLCIVFAQGAGFVGLLATSAPGSWYRSLVHPPGTPPGYVFGIVWPVLYLLIGMALYIFLRNAQREQLTYGLTVFALQWLTNAIWTPLFFGLHLTTVALVDLVILLGLILLNWKIFDRASRGSGILLMPYFAWCLYATYLNLGYVWLNG